MKFVFVILAGVSSIASAQDTFESCVTGLTQDFLAGTQLNLTDVKVVDYGFADYTIDEQSNEHGKWRKTKTLQKSFTSQFLQVEGSNGRTKLAFPLEIDLYEVKMSDFGSGQAEIVKTCCSRKDKITIVDTATQQKKEFPIVRNCSTVYKELEKNERVVTIAVAPANLCATYGKKADTWSTIKDRLPGSLPRLIPCDREEQRSGNYSCLPDLGPSYREVTTYKGCRRKKTQ